MLKAFDTSNVIMQIMIISVFIGIFFFTYGAYLEKKILQNQLDFLVDDSLDSLKIFMPEISDSLKKPLREYQIKLNPNADKQVDNANKQTMKKAMYAILVGFVIGIIIIYVLYKKLDMEGNTTKQFVMKLVKYNLMSLIVVGLTEFSFATGFAKNFMSLDLNRIKKEIVNNLINLKKK